MIRHGETGLLFPVGDVGALATLVVTVAADPDLRRRIAAAARRAAEHHCLVDPTEAYEGVLAETLQAHEGTTS